MRILYLAHRVPFPPNKGEKIRAFHELRCFSERHEIHLLAFADNPEDLAHKSALRQHCADVQLIPLVRRNQIVKAGLAMVRHRPWTLGYFNSAPMWQAVANKLQSVRFDLLFSYSSSMAPYIRSVPSIPKMLDFVDSDASKWSQYAHFKKFPAGLLYAFESKMLSRFEGEMAGTFDRCVFVSAREAAHIENKGCADRVAFVQNGIDLDFFRPCTDAAPKEPIVVFTGAMDYFPNVDAVTYFADRILPRVRLQIPEARLLIVGSNPSPAVRRLERNGGVIVTGSVADIRPYFSSARVAIAPLRISQGIQNKVLEAIAMGLPVVASKAAAEGIIHTASLPIRVAEGEQEFAERTSEVLSMPPLSRKEIDRYREVLRLKYDWNTNLSQFETLFQSVGCPASQPREVAFS